MGCTQQLANCGVPAGIPFFGTAWRGIRRDSERVAAVLKETGRQARNHVMKRIGFWMEMERRTDAKEKRNFAGVGMRHAFDRGVQPG